MSGLQQAELEPVSVLLVDDEENILRSIQRLLMDVEDIEISITTSGEEGLKIMPVGNQAMLIEECEREVLEK